MNLFTRITTTLGASADNVVSRFENHEAIAESNLAQARQALMRARQRQCRLQETGDNIRKRLADRQTEAQRWTERACKLANSDKSRALDCVAQRKVCKEQIEQLQQSLFTHEALEEQMVRQLQDMQQRLEKMSNQWNELRSRESLAKAMQVMDRIDSSGNDGVDAVFDRWEMSIGDTQIRHEVQTETACTKSPLQRELEAEERDTALKDELAELLSGKENNSNE